MEEVTDEENLAPKSTIESQTRTNNQQEYGTNVENSGQTRHVVTEPEDPPDGGWGWVVCVTAMMANGTVAGFINYVPVFYVAILKEFGEDAEGGSAVKTSWVGATVVTTTFVFGSVAGVVSDRYGIRKTGFAGGVITFLATLTSAFVTNLMLLSFTFGFFMGAGFAFPFTLSVVILGHYFKKRLGLVSSLMTFSSGVISAVFVLVLPHITASMGMRKSMLCLSAFNAFMMIYPLAWVPVKRSTTAEPSQVKEKATETNKSNCENSLRLEETVPILRDEVSPQKNIFNARIWRHSHFVVWVIGCAIGHFSYFVAPFHIVKYSEDKFPDRNANLHVVIYAIAMALCRLLSGLVADLELVKPHYIRIHQLCFFIMGITTIALTFANKYEVFLLASGFLGMCDGAFFLLVGPIVLSLVEVADSSQAVGFFFGLIALPHGFGPVIAAAIYDHFGTYTWALRVMGIPSLAGALLLFLIDVL